MSSMESSSHRTMLRSMDYTMHSNEFDRLLLEAATYHGDELDHVEFGDVSQNINAYMLPDRSRADALIEAYFSSLHPLFPVLLESVFRSQYDTTFIGAILNQPQR